MDKNNLTLEQRTILQLLGEKPRIRAELGSFAIKSARRDLRALERMGLVTHEVKFSDNQVDERLRRLPGTRYFLYSLVK